MRTKLRIVKNKLTFKERKIGEQNQKEHVKKKKRRWDAEKMLGKLCRAEDKNNMKCIYRGSEITLPKSDSNHRETNQDNWGRGDGNSRDRGCEKKHL